jgi:hypothetical protein
VRDVLRYRLGAPQHISVLCDYTLGTVQADAYLAGGDEGHRIALDAERAWQKARLIELMDGAA